MENLLNDSNYSEELTIDDEGDYEDSLFEDELGFRYRVIVETHEFDVGCKVGNKWHHVGILQPAGMRIDEILTEFRKGSVYGKYFE